MNILLKTKKLYDEIGIDMYRDISAYSINGYVFITPETFMVGKGVRTDSDTKPQDQWNVKNPNAWYIHMAVGKIKNFWKYLPYPLPKIGFMRATKNQPIRWYDFNRIKRRK